MGRLGERGRSDDAQVHHRGDRRSRSDWRALAARQDSRAGVEVSSRRAPAAPRARYDRRAGLVFVALVLGFFALAVLFVRACELVLGARRRSRRNAVVSVENVIGLVLAVAVLAYLVYALLAPERLG